MNLLIVDDHQPMRRLIKSLLADLAENISECADGAEALEIYRQTRPDWVLMDIEMNTVDGLTATSRITAAFPEARVVIVTNYDNAKLRSAASAAGACGYVLKEDLSQLREVLTERRRRQPRDSPERNQVQTQRRKS